MLGRDRSIMKGSLFEEHRTFYILSLIVSRYFPENLYLAHCGNTPQNFMFARDRSVMKVNLHDEHSTFCAISLILYKGTSSNQYLALGDIDLQWSCDWSR